MVNLLQQVYQLLHLLPERSDGETALLRVVVVAGSVGGDADTDAEVVDLSPALLLLQLLLHNLISLVLDSLQRFMNNIDAEDAVRVAE